MDLLFLHKLGLVVTNARNMLRDRGFDVQDLNALIGSTPLETSGNIYKKSLDLQCSLAEACRFTLEHSSNKNYSSKNSSTKDSSTARLWILDRNYDFIKCKERMTSTDQIKAIYDSIAAEPTWTHIVIGPTKCSPQAKKELNVNAELFIFDDLLIDLPRHIQVSKHSLVSEDSMKKYFGLTFKSKDLPLLPRSDPLARWYSWPSGSIVFVDNPIMPKFRLVL